MLLEQIHTPEDVKALPAEELPQLARELRCRIISTVSKNGGHLASNLGTVELTVALHRVFSCPQDKIVWDVGHQAYAHKLLTGRQEQFDTLRRQGGLSGFPKQSESEYDAYLGGHSGVSISAALGIAAGMRASGQDGYAIAVIGDGSFGSGIAYEGLNNAGRSGEKLILVLNDNEMSISQNVGSVAGYLAKIRTSKPYFELKDGAKSVLDNLPVLGAPVREALAKSKQVLRQTMYHSNFFEDLGYKYLGPADGHDLQSLFEVLERAREYAGPCVVHVHTIKGCGYRPARENPSRFHGVGAFDPHTGRALSASGSTFSGHFGSLMLQLAQRNSRISVITAAMADGTGLSAYAARYQGSRRFYEVGIAEEHAVSFACGMSTQGMVPVFAVYSTFLQRTCDQLIHDAAIEPKHIVLAVDRAGFVGEDGETHQGIFDVPLLCMIPGVTVYSPATFAQQEAALRSAVSEACGPVAVRWSKGGEGTLCGKYLGEYTGDYALVGSPEAALLVGYGRQVEELLAAREALQERGVSVGVLALHRIHPLPEQALEQMLSSKLVLFAEECVQGGSVAQQTALKLLERGFAGRYATRTVEQGFVPHGTVAQAYQSCGLDSAAITETIWEMLS